MTNKAEEIMNRFRELVNLVDFTGESPTNENRIGDVKDYLIELLESGVILEGKKLTDIVGEEYKGEIDCVYARFEDLLKIIQEKQSVNQLLIEAGEITDGKDQA